MDRQFHGQFDQTRAGYDDQLVTDCREKAKFGAMVWLYSGTRTGQTTDTGTISKGSPCYPYDVLASRLVVMLLTSPLGCLSFSSCDGNCPCGTLPATHSIRAHFQVVLLLLIQGASTFRHASIARRSDSVFAQSSRHRPPKYELQSPNHPLCPLCKKREKVPTKADLGWSSPPRTAVILSDDRQESNISLTEAKQHDIVHFQYPRSLLLS